MSVRLYPDRYYRGLARAPIQMSSDRRLLVYNSEDHPKVDRDEGVVEAPTEPRLQEPPMYKVVLLNDDYTPMEFVVEVLQIFFGMDREKATQVMLAVHTTGKATCGIFTKDVAETKSTQVNQYAQDNDHPLVSDVEAVE